MIGERKVKKKRTITPENLEKMRAARKVWYESMTPEQRAAFHENNAKAAEIGRLRAELKKMKARRKKARVDHETDAPMNEKISFSEPVTNPVAVSAGSVIREEVASFAKAMEHKLHKRDGYGGWRSLPLQYIREKLKGELNELLVALEYETDSEVMSECVDVANYAMFLWDIMRSSDPRSNAQLIGRKKEDGRS